MSTAKPAHLIRSRAHAGTVVLALAADVRIWANDSSAVDLLADAWDALEAVTAGMDWLHVGQHPGDDVRGQIARLYELPSGQGR